MAVLRKADEALGLEELRVASTLTEERFTPALASLVTDGLASREGECYRLPEATLSGVG